MAQTNLTDEEKQAIIEAINSETEPSPELVAKLFPYLAEKVDIATLDKAKVPTLEYAGKRSRAAILAEASAGIGAGPLQVVRCFREEDAKDDWRNLIRHIGLHTARCGSSCYLDVLFITPWFNRPPAGTVGA